MDASARRAKHKEELRRQILDGAREIFIHDGYESFSLRKLAARIGYSPASVYLHFKNKAELFDCLIQEAFLQLAKELPPAPAAGADPVAQLKRGLQTYVKFGLDNPNHYRFAFLLQPPRPAQPPKPQPAFESLRIKVRRCVEERRFPSKDVETMSQALWAAAHGVTSLLIERPAFPWVERNKLIRRVIDSAVDSLAAPAKRVK